MLCIAGRLIRSLIQCAHEIEKSSLVTVTFTPL